MLNLCGVEVAVAKCFKFEKFWVREDSYFGVITETWQKCMGGSPAWILFKKIRAVRSALR